MADGPKNDQRKLTVYSHLAVPIRVYTIASPYERHSRSNGIQEHSPFTPVYNLSCI